MKRPPRAHPLWLAFWLHRLSGLALALFLPVHFSVLALALTGPERLDRALAITEHPLMKLTEMGLVFLLAVHAFGGLRLLALEWLPWGPGQKTLAAGAVAISAFFSLGFALRAF